MWDYSEANRLLTLESVTAKACIFCMQEMFLIPAEQFEVNDKRLILQFRICPACGWWTVYRVHQGEHPRTRGLAEGYSGSIGCLKQLDLCDISLPLGEIRQYIRARSDKMYCVHPRIFEEIVCSVFKDLGWTAQTTAYSGDDGIDIVLEKCDGNTVGVQVKRNNKSRQIEAEQIRALTGALVLNGHTKGIFVTTSSCRSGAVRTASKMTAIGYPVDLIDAAGFLEALGLAQIRSFELSQEQVIAKVLLPGVHLGTGIETPFTPGEDLTERPIVLQTFTSDELLEYSESFVPFTAKS